MMFPATLPVRRFAYVAGVALAAFASGHFVQSGTGPAAAPAVALPAPAPVPVPEITVVPAPDCARTATVESGLAGMLRVVLHAPCAPGAPVRVAQGALVADWTLDAEGTRHLSFVPMSTDHPLLVTWPDGTTSARALPESADAATYRAALAWDGPRLLSLDAEEFGAASDRPGLIAAAATGLVPQSGGGFLTVLGDGTGRMAEVYTFPAEAFRSQGVVRLSASAPITLATCGRRAKATALQSDPFGGLMTSRVDVALPDCDGIGQTLVLRNLFRDLRLAAH